MSFDDNMSKSNNVLKGGAKTGFSDEGVPVTQPQWTK